jgi:ribosomal protein S8
MGWFILGYKIDSENSDKIKIFLKYREGKPTINAIKLISKPSRRIYSTKQIWKSTLVNLLSFFK